MKLFRQKLWRTLSVVGIIIAVIVVTLTGIANAFAPMVNDLLGIEGSTVGGGSSDEDTQYFKSDYNNLDEMIKAKTQLVREIVQEGTVLLKNENSLPVRSGKVTIYGDETLRYSSNSGGGSMGDYEAGAAKLSEALKNNGLTVNTDASAASGSAAAFVIISRAGGEGSDVPFGGLALTSAEIGQIEAAKAEKSKNKQKKEDQKTGVICIVAGIGIMVAGGFYYDHAKANYKRDKEIISTIKEAGKSENSTEKLKQLTEMYNSKMITEEEFEKKKKEILDKM